MYQTTQNYRLTMQCIICHWSQSTWMLIYSGCSVFGCESVIHIYNYENWTIVAWHVILPVTICCVTSTTWNKNRLQRNFHHSIRRTLTWTSPCRLFGTKCAKCGNGFSKNDFVMRARNKIFHIDCFRCVACSRQLIPGDEFALRDDGLFCKADHEVVERATNTPNGSKSENSDSGVGSPSNNNNNESKPNLHASGKKNFSFSFWPQ